jgi:hypothetical protein
MQATFLRRGAITPAPAITTGAAFRGRSRERMAGRVRFRPRPKPCPFSAAAAAPTKAGIPYLDRGHDLETAAGGAGSGRSPIQNPHAVADPNASAKPMPRRTTEAVFLGVHWVGTGKRPKPYPCTGPRHGIPMRRRLHILRIPAEARTRREQRNRHEVGRSKPCAKGPQTLFRYDSRSCYPGLRPKPLAEISTGSSTKTTKVFPTPETAGQISVDRASAKIP